MQTLKNKMQNSEYYLNAKLFQQETIGALFYIHYASRLEKSVTQFTASVKTAESNKIAKHD
ncbi:MAG: hypothetical protein ACRCXW_13370 [Plesiomonas shigelloides]